MGNGLCVEAGSSMTVFDWLDHLMGTISTRAGLKSIQDDDFIDRLSHFYTVLMLLVLTLVMSTSQFVGEPIQCWCPADFTYSRVDYTNFVCWVSNTYFIPMDQQIPEPVPEREAEELTYYQWVPLILLTLAGLFKVPRLFWKSLVSSSGISMDKLGVLARETQILSPEDREKRLKHIVKYLDQWLGGCQHHRAGLCVRIREKIYQTVFCCVCGRHNGNYLVICVLFVKFLYLANSIALMFLMNIFLGGDYNIYGIEVLDALYHGEDWVTSPRFPRVTLCDFEIRQLTNIQRWTLQCVLPINLFNEKFFIFLWFWFVFLAALHTFSLLANIYAYIFPSHKLSYIKKYLLLNNFYSRRQNTRGKEKEARVFDPVEKERKIVQSFVEDYLKQDGCYILRVFGNNATDTVTSAIIRHLFIGYKERFEIEDESET